MLISIRGTYSDGKVTLHETPGVPDGTSVIVFFLPKDSGDVSFETLFPYLCRWVDLGNELRMGQDLMYYSQSLVHCFDEGGTIYESPADVTDLQQALELADAAIHDWLADNMPDELDEP